MPRAQSTSEAKRRVPQRGSGFLFNGRRFRLVPHVDNELGIASNAREHLIQLGIPYHDAKTDQPRACKRKRPEPKGLGNMTGVRTRLSTLKFCAVVGTHGKSSPLHFVAHFSIDLPKFCPRIASEMSQKVWFTGRDGTRPNNLKNRVVDTQWPISFCLPSSVAS